MSVDTQAWREAAKLVGLTLLGVALLVAFGVALGMGT